MDDVDEMVREGFLSAGGARVLRDFMAKSGQSALAAMDHLGLWQAGGHTTREQWRDRLARRDERAAIVAWLREPWDPADPGPGPVARLIADAIERGDHLA